MDLKRHMMRTSHYVTWSLGTRFPNAIPLVFVVAFPRSGTTWVSQLVADYLELPFPRRSLLPVACKAVVHGHDRVWKSYRKGVYVGRDGRDAMASLYLRAPERMRRGGIAAFVERHVTARKPWASPCNWADHVRSYFEVRNPNVAFVRYEDLLQDGEAAFAKVMTDLTGGEADLERVRDAVRKFSFKRQAGGRPAGVEHRNAWLRKGQSGDWVNHLDLEAVEIFDRYCGDMLIQIGYEKDRSWVQSFRDGSYEAPHLVPVSA